MTVENGVLEKFGLSATLPQFPQVLLKLIEALDDQESTIDSLAGLISSDPVLSSRLMEIIGSAAINLPKEINSIENAVVYLGIDTIKNITISSSALHLFRTVKVIPEFDISQFWFHSYKCGLTAKKLASETGLAEPDEAFLSGLLHDIGRLMLAAHYPDDYASILKSNSSEHEILHMEQETFGTNSSEISAWMFRRWNLSSLCSDAVLYINNTAEEIASALILVKIVFLAHILARQGKTVPLDDIERLSPIDRQRLTALAAEADLEARGMAETLGITIAESTAEGQEETRRDNDPDRQLASRLQDMTLFYGTLQNLFKAEDRAAVLNITDTGLKLLFGINRIFYFLYDEDKTLLTGFCNAEDRHHKVINSIAVPWSNATSILTRSLATNTRMNSFETDVQAKSAICDMQIIRLLETEGMVSVPMVSADKPIGIIVLGASRNQLNGIEEKKTLLDLFARQAALCIRNIQFRNEYAVMLQNERMQAFSTITRKIIHEVNNPIVIITNYLKMLSLKLPDKHPVQSELSVINEEINRISTLIQGLSGFSKPEINEFGPVNINQLYRSVLDVISKSLLLPRGIKATLNADPEIPVIKTDKNGLKQVFINLLKNASEAMPDGGEITIATRFIPESAKIMIDEKKKMPGSIEIIISDNGPGIPDPIMARLFEPYNSSKQENNSGLGLSIVHSIIKLLNGTITCRSKEGNGTTFTILLPVLSNKRNSRPQIDERIV